jgi:uncharacterized protein YegL
MAKSLLVLLGIAAILLMPIVPAGNVGAHHVDIRDAEGRQVEPPVHEHIMTEGAYLLEEDPYTKAAAYPEVLRYLTGRAGTDLRSGSRDEDLIGDLSGDNLPAYGAAPFREHYWDPDGGIGDGLYAFRSAAQRAQDHWNQAIANYKKGNFDLAYWYLGRVCHLLQDMSVPAHVHNDDHAGYVRELDAPFWLDTLLNPYDPSGGKDRYEQWIGTDGMHYTEYTRNSCSGPELHEEWTLVGTSGDNGFMWSLAEIADDWDSDDVNGEDDNLEWIGDVSDDHCQQIADALMPAAIEYTAGLLQRFYESVPHVDLQCDNKSKEANSDKDTYFDLRVYNEGGIEDEFEVTYEVIDGDDSKWDISLHTYGATGFKDKLTLTIRPSNFENIFLKVKPHSDVQEGESIKIKVTSKLTRAITNDPERDKYYTSEVELTATNGGKSSAVMVVLDVSGSMSGSYLDQAKHSASIFVGHLTEADQVGVVQFDDSYSVIYSLTDVTSETKSGAQAAINGASGGGYTSIGGGLQTAASALSGASDDYAKIIVLLTDGEENTEPWVADVKPSIIDQGITIHNVGLGSADAEQLLGLAQDTGGTFMFADDESSLGEIYNQFRRDIGDLTNISSDEGHLVQDEVNSFDVPVDDSIDSLSISVQYQGSDIDLIITVPDGSEISASDPQVDRMEEGPTYEFWEISDPEPGEYTVSAVGVDIPDGGEDYLLEADASSSIIATVSTNKDEYLPGEWMKVSAFALQDLQSLSGLSVSANITTGLYTSELLTLFDDGEHGDGEVNDGVYANFFNGTATTGTYTVVASFEGQTVEGRSFARKATTTCIVSPVDVLTAVISSPGEDETFAKGESILFVGAAYDPSWGAVEDSYITWNSTIDGDLGTGGNLTLSDLSSGEHIIAMQVSSPSSNETVLRTVLINVEGGGSANWLIPALIVIVVFLCLGGGALLIMRRG